MLARKALAGTAGVPKVYVEDVFSTYLYTGNDSTQTITNNIDLSSEGGLIWLKKRNSTGGIHGLWDTARGGTKRLDTSSSLGESTLGSSFTFNSNGFTIPTGGSSYLNESSSNIYTSWTFRKAEKFFDIVTYSGDSVDNRVISHNLGSTPGCILVARRSGDDWFVYHRSLSANYGLRLNRVDSESSNTASIKSVSSTTFTIGTDGMVNTSGSDYVAYLFAHDAGGFGDAGSDSIIKCGSITTDSNGEFTETLGWEPQWLLLKPSSTTGNWTMGDIMRGWNVQSGSNIQRLFANTTGAESLGGQLNPTATGFKSSNSGAFATSTTYVYIAIRRGPMKTPTSGTDVFAPIYANQSAGTKNTTNFPVDAIIVRSPGAGENNHLISRLTGVSSSSTESGWYLYTQATDAEGSSGITRGWDNTGFQSTSGYAGYNVIYLPFRRAPGFFDVVCYTGTGSATTVSHNLGVAPELMIIKNRNAVTHWPVYYGNSGTYMHLSLNDAASTSGSFWNSTSPTSSVFTVGTSNQVNGSTNGMVAYLFASLSGVSKVGSYTGNGSSVTVTTGFQPRFIMVKRTDSTGDWIVGNSARGLVAGDDPYIELNTTDAEVTNDDWVDITSTSFTVNQTATSNANVNTGTYIYLAIA